MSRSKSSRAFGAASTDVVELPLSGEDAHPSIVVFSDDCGLLALANANRLMLLADDELVASFEFAVDNIPVCLDISVNSYYYFVNLISLCL
jgi:hypothetical protein